MRYTLVAVMIAHGIAHLVGFAVPWKLTATAEPYRTTILGGMLDLGQAGIRVYGIAWLVLGLGFIVAAIGLFFRMPWWYPTAITFAGLSTLFCLLSLPEARIGIIVNLFVVAAILVSGRMLGQARFDS